MIEIDRDITQDFARASGLEWLETNGLGGWAGTTVAGMHSRRHHGLLVAPTGPEAGRTILLSRLDETLHVEGESFELSCNQFPGAIAPRGYEHLTSFRQNLFPTFEFEAGGVRLRKTVAAVDGENTTLVLYEALEAPGPFILSLRPFLAARDPQHPLTAANQEISQQTPFADGVLRLRPYPDSPQVFLGVPGADFRPGPQWWYRFEYERDRRRGMDFQEDLWTPGVFGRELAPGDRLGVILSTQDPAGRDAFALFEKERKRREKIVKALPAQDDFARQLALAADGYVVRRGPSREALIALPGLYLATGRHEEAKKSLRAFAKSSRNLTGDAQLWLFVAAWKYLQATGDETFARDTLLPALRKIARQYDEGAIQGDVESNALWFNALSILADFDARLGDAGEAKAMAQRAKQVQKGFQEVVSNGEPGHVLALGLPFPLLPKAKAARALDALAETSARPELTWRLGLYLTALVRFQGAAGRKKGLALIEELKPRLAEAEEDFASRSAGVAEVLRAYVEDLRSPAKEKSQAKAKPAPRKRTR